MDPILLVVSVILLACIAAGRLSSRVGIPVLLLFLVLGMMVGIDGLLKIPFSDYDVTNQICTVTLIIIMFYGGFGTNWKVARAVAPQAFLLASAGVVATAGLTGLFCRYVLGFEPLESMLIGSVISSTDAASVFSILRSKKMNLRGGLTSMLQLESGSNDPTAYMLTVILLGLMTGDDTGGLPLLILSQVAFGLLCGALSALASTLLLRQSGLLKDGQDAIFALATALLAYSSAQLLGGNGYLSVYVAGIVLGNSPIHNKAALVHFFDGVTELMQILLFFLLGLLAYPSEMTSILPASLAIALFLTLVGRPLAVFAVLTPFRIPFRQQLLMAWSGLRGAASIVFAIMVTVSDAYTSNDVFHIVFCVAILSVLVQGTLLPVVARRLGLVDDSDSSLRTFNDYIDESEMELIQMTLSTGHPWESKRLREISLPDDSIVVTLKRGGDTLIPNGDTLMLPGDTLIMNCRRFTDYADIKLTEIPLPAGHEWINRQLKDIRIGKSGALVVMIRRGGGMIIPDGNTLLQEGDVLILNA